MIWYMIDDILSTIMITVYDRISVMVAIQKLQKLKQPLKPDTVFYLWVYKTTEHFFQCEYHKYFCIVRCVRL